MKISPNDVARLKLAQTIWLATVRPSGSPHLVPLWFTWYENKAYVCTSARSVKAQNMRRNPKVTIALEDGSDPLVIEAQATRLEEVPAPIVKTFRDKYDWDINVDSTYDAVFELTPTKVLL